MIDTIFIFIINFFTINLKILENKNGGFPFALVIIKLEFKHDKIKKTYLPK